MILLMDHEHWMREALVEAEIAAQKGEIPVGAVVVWRGEVIGRGHNRKEAYRDPTAHAEMIALREAAAKLQAWRLTGSALYCTLEPCCMCAGALVNARVDELVFAIRDPKTGAAGSVYDIVRSPWLNHRLRVTSGVLSNQAQDVMQRFFERLRRERESCS